jgi:cobalamin biosynthesis Mg chelatase CobN
MNRFSCGLSEKKKDGREREREREIEGYSEKLPRRIRGWSVGERRSERRKKELIFNEARRGSCFRKAEIRFRLIAEPNWTSRPVRRDGLRNDNALPTPRNFIIIHARFIPSPLSLRFAKVSRLINRHRATSVATISSVIAERRYTTPQVAASR